MGDIKTNADAIEGLSFEQAISNLEETILRMESGETPLESLVKNYQIGVKLLKHCREKIDAAEMKIKEVHEIDGYLVEKEFDDLA